MNTAPEPTVEQQIQFQRQVMQVAEAVTRVVREVEPHLATIALLTVATTAAQATGFTRDQLAGLLVDGYDKTKASMEALGLRPGEEPPPGTKERIEQMMREQLGADPTAR